jgi:hypothetical protein
MNEKNRQLDAKVSQLEKENRTIDETAKHFLSEKDKQMIDLAMQNENYRLELRAGHSGSC